MATCKTLMSIAGRVRKILVLMGLAGGRDMHVFLVSHHSVTVPRLYYNIKKCFCLFNLVVSPGP